MPLLSDSELGALQYWARNGMTDTVTIQRPVQVDSAYGDDESVSYTNIGTTQAWFRSIPTPIATAETGQLITVNTYRLLVPVGTDIMPKDQVVFGSEVFIVTDTTAESTWQAMLTVSLRRRE